MAKAELRRSIFRILSDLIKSDDVITVAELEELDAAARHYGIDSSDKEAGFQLTLADAFACIAVQSTKTKEEIRETMRSIALKDNECCRAEAFFLVAIDWLCEGKDIRILSYPMKNRSLLGSQMVYIENKKTFAGRAILDDKFQEISNLVKLVGLELIYIPEVAKSFKLYENGQDLRKLLSLISPQSRADDLDNTIDAIEGMTTRWFYENVVEGKLDMPMDIDEPSWILRIADSQVDGTGYINLLCFKAENDVRGQLASFAACLNSHQASYTVKVNDGRTGTGHFIYSGFFKALLDLMSVKHIDKWDLHFRLYGDGVDMFRYMAQDGSEKKCCLTIRRGGEEYPIPLTGRDAAFYLLLLCASAEGNGIDFHDPKMERIVQMRYGQLFRALSRRSEEPLVWDPVFRVPMRSRVASAINESVINKLSSLQSLYLPTDEKRGLLHVDIEPSRVFIESVSGTVPLKQSALYRIYQMPKKTEERGENARR